MEADIFKSEILGCPWVWRGFRCIQCGMCWFCIIGKVSGAVPKATKTGGEFSYRLGRSLVFDPAKEAFVADEQADALLTRTYREGFEVPVMA